MTTTARPMGLADVVAPGKDKKISARASGRKVTIRNHAVVTVRRTFFAWLFGVKKVGPKKAKRKVPNSVEFYVYGIERIKWKKPWLLTGVFVIWAPAGGGDPWRPSGKEKPHRLRYSRGRAAAKMLAVAWAINLGAQRYGGPPLGELPSPVPIEPSWWERQSPKMGRWRELIAFYREQR